MKYRLQLIFLILLLSGMGACGGSDNGAQQSDTRLAESSAAVFDKDMRKRGCEILTAELVSETFGVPADALRQMKIMGCRYDWEEDGQTLESSMTMIQAHKSEAGANSWFASATKNRTAEEMQQEMDKVAGRLDESEQLDTEAKKSTAKNLLKTVGAKAVNFEDVNGVGDEARVSDTGTVYVRVGNLTFMVSAYKGPTAPPVDYTGVDLKQIAKIAQENARKWEIESAPQRKIDSVRLAKVIVAEL